jgi:hypothetical protein
VIWRLRKVEAGYGQTEPSWGQCPKMGLGSFVPAVREVLTRVTAIRELVRSCEDRFVRSIVFNNFLGSFGSLAFCVLRFRDPTGRAQRTKGEFFGSKFRIIEGAPLLACFVTLDGGGIAVHSAM